MNKQTPEQLAELEKLGGPYKYEVIADSSGKWVSNAMKYDTVALANDAGEELYSRWILVKEWRVAKA